MPRPRIGAWSSELGALRILFGRLIIAYHISIAGDRARFSSLSFCGFRNCGSPIFSQSHKSNRGTDCAFSNPFRPKPRFPADLDIEKKYEISRYVESLQVKYFPLPLGTKTNCKTKAFAQKFLNNKRTKKPIQNKEKTLRRRTKKMLQTYGNAAVFYSPLSLFAI